MALPTRQDESTQPRAWEPFRELQRLTDQLSRSMDGWSDLPSLLNTDFTPMADVEETDDEYLIEIELPGVHKNDIDISVAGQRVTVSGERKEKERAGILRRRTRSVGRFRYEVVLPEDVDDANVTASLDGGVLSLRVPKRQSERPRHIEVK